MNVARQVSPLPSSTPSRPSKQKGTLPEAKPGKSSTLAEGHAASPMALCMLSCGLSLTRERRLLFLSYCGVLQASFTCRKQESSLN